MKKLILLLHFTFGILNFTFSQTAPGIEWQNTIGGSNWDELRCTKQTADKGYILGGISYSDSSGDKTENNLDSTCGTFCTADYWLIKTDSLGNIQWQNTIGGSGDDYLFSLQQTTDGGYILGGDSRSDISGDKSENCIGLRDYWLVKTDSVGNIQWQNTIGGSDDDYFSALEQTTDGGYILGGGSNSNISGDKTENCNFVWDYWIVKTDSAGNIQWQNTIGGSGSEWLNSIQQTDDGGYIIGGVSNSDISGDKTENNLDTTQSTWDYWIVKTDSVGNIEWQNTIGGSLEDWLQSVQQTTDGGYILGGFSFSNISGDKAENNIGPLNTTDYWIVKTDGAGNILWQNTIGGNEADCLFSIGKTSEGKYLLGGWSNSSISGDKTENHTGPLYYYDCWIIKTDSVGNIEWQNTIGGSRDDKLTSFIHTIEGGYILGGSSSSNISGDKTENNIDTTCNLYCSYDYWIVKLYPDTTTSISNIQPSINNIQLYPNPTKNEITISGYTLQDNQPAQLKIFDVMGNQVLTQTVINSNTNLQTINFAGGVYFMQLQSGSNISRAKFVKQ